jgi:hypothetical protein
MLLAGVFISARRSQPLEGPLSADKLIGYLLKLGLLLQALLLAAYLNTQHLSSAHFTVAMDNSTTKLVEIIVIAVLALILALVLLKQTFAPALVVLVSVVIFDAWFTPSIYHTERVAVPYILLVAALALVVNVLRDENLRQKLLRK